MFIYACVRYINRRLRVVTVVGDSVRDIVHRLRYNIPERPSFIDFCFFHLLVHDRPKKKNYYHIITIWRDHGNNFHRWLPYHTHDLQRHKILLRSLAVHAPLEFATENRYGFFGWYSSYNNWSATSKVDRFLPIDRCWGWMSEWVRVIRLFYMERTCVGRRRMGRDCWTSKR